MNDNKSIFFDKVMYHEDGTFRPFVGHHGNIDGEIADHRNIFMEAEREYFSVIFKDRIARDAIKDLLINRTADDLYDEACALQERIETGQLESLKERIIMQSMSPEQRDEYHLRMLEYAEAFLCILFASIRDKALILDEISLWEERLSQGGRGSSL